MNNKRRSQINKIVETLEEAKQQLLDILNDEQESFDNTPENLQDSERGIQSLAAIESLEEGETLFDELIDTLNNAAQ